MRNIKAFNYLVLADSQLSFLPVYVIGMYDCYSTTFPQTVNDIVEILDTIQVWPEEVVGDMGSE